jgi:predicted patatin/cPLA2 family phospholipase
MRTGSATLGWTFLTAVLCAGCSIERAYPPPSLPPSSRLLEVRAATEAPLPESVRADRELSQASFRPRHVLVLSGGGSNGAFTAGVLKGWTARGDRPRFDVVTGISAGALIAPFAFLGSEYDDILERSATEMQTSDVFHRRLWPALLWSDSLTDSAPLRRKIESEITPDLVDRVAQAHAGGRRLYVGTTDLDTKRLVVWDLGAIAAGDHPKKLALFHDVLLASASVPGVLPPVAINVAVDGQPYTELHVDGGVSASLFLQPAMLGLHRDRDLPAGGDDMHVHVIVAGKLQPPRRPVERRLFPVAGESIGGVLQSRFEGDLLRVYLLARFAGARFALAALPDDFPEEHESLSFDPQVMRAMFERGCRSGTGGPVWQPFPPSLTPGAHAPPRGGVRFTVEEIPSWNETAPPARSDLYSTRAGVALQRLFHRVRDDLRRGPRP